jgi:hypothetical protein
MRDRYLKSSEIRKSLFLTKNRRQEGGAESLQDGRMDQAWMIHPFLPGVAPVGQRSVADSTGAGVQPAQVPYRVGAIHVIFKPLGFIARLAALVSRLRVNQTRYYGLFARGSLYIRQVSVDSVAAV